MSDDKQKAFNEFMDHFVDADIPDRVEMLRLLLRQSPVWMAHVRDSFGKLDDDGSSKELLARFATGGDALFRALWADTVFLEMVAKLVDIMVQFTGTTLFTKLQQGFKDPGQITAFMKAFGLTVPTDEAPADAPPAP